MATNRYIIQLIVDTGSGEAKVKGVSKAFEDLDNQVKRAQASINKGKKSLDDLGGAAGIAGATAAELGRTISDLPYGISAVTNNISQLGSMFALLVSSSKGVDGAFKNLGQVMAGPAGTLILFQSAVAAVDFFSQALRRNQAEAKKEAEELKNINEELEKQETLLLSSSRTAFLYAKDINAALGTNVKEVSDYLAEVRKEGPITEEVFNKAIQSGRKLLEARKESNLIEKDIIKTQERLNELGGLNADKEAIMVAAVKEHNLANQTFMSIFKPKMSIEEAMQDILDKRKKVLGDLNLLSLKQGEANEKEAEALKLLNYQATEEIVVTGKLKKEKEDDTEATENNTAALNRQISSRLRSIREISNEINARQRYEFLQDQFNEDAQNKYLAYLESLAKNEQLSYEERAKYQAQYNSLKQSLANQEVAIETAKTSAIAQQRTAELELVATVFKGIGQLAGENRTLQALSLVGESAAGIAKIVINTKAANAALTLQAAAFPPLAPALQAQKIANNISAAAGIAANISSTAKALSALKAPVGSPSVPSVGSDGAGSGVAAPAFNIVGAGGQSQLAQAIAGQQQSPIKAYVVSGEVSTAQSLERNRIREASI